MHSLAGALGESTEVYGKAISQALASVNELTVLSFGLGLGYNEIIFAALTVCQPEAAHFLLSLEIDQQLIQQFRGWCEGSYHQLNFIYDDILNRVSEKFDIDAREIKKNLLQKMERNKMIIGTSLTDFSHLKFNCILYDPFSSGSSPELWEEENLYNLLQNRTADVCHFSTYAAKSSLKRALLRNQFTVSILEGFAGKRNRISATRTSP